MHDLLLFIFIYIITGCCAGFLAGFFGIGGGTLYVPILMTTLPYFHRSPQLFHVVLCTSLLLVAPCGLGATIKHIYHKHLPIKTAISWGVFVLLGSASSLFLVILVPDTALRIIFCVYITLICLFRIGTHHIKRKEIKNDKDPSLFIRAPGGYIIGLLSIFFGDGGGIPSNTFLYFLGYPIRQCIALASFQQIIIGLTGGLGLMLIGLGTTDLPAFSFGYLNWLGFACLAPSILLVAPIGVHVSNWVSEKNLKRAYLALIVIVTLYVLFKTYLHFFVHHHVF